LNTQKHIKLFPDLIDFDSLKEVSITIGGKGNNLSLLKIINIPIPKTLALTHLDPHDTEALDICVNEIFSKQLFSNKPLIVRSSAIVEDGASQSYAGQFKSIKCENTYQSLKNAIKEVLQSGQDVQASSYSKHFNKELGRMSILIQEYHAALISGVAFSKHPINTSLKGLYVEWTTGNLEHLVQGEITPHSEIIEEGKSPKHFPKDISESLQNYTKKIKEKLNSEVDIEWLVTLGGKLIILQARPITSLYNTKPISILLRDNIGENYPEPVVPFLASLASKSYYYYFRSLAKSFGFKNGLIEKHDADFKSILAVENAYLCYNIKAISELFSFVPFFGDTLAKKFSNFIGREEEQTFIKNEPPNRRRFTDYVQATILIWYSLFSLVKIKKQIHLHKTNVDLLSENLSTNLNLKNVDDLAKAFSKCLNIRYFQWHGPAFADAICMIIGGLLSKETIRSINLNTSPVATEFSNLLRVIEQDEYLYKVFKTETSQRILEIFSTTSPKSYSIFKSFSKSWGYRRPGELLLTIPDFDEDPLSLIHIIKLRLEQIDSKTPTSISETNERTLGLKYILKCLYSFGANQREIARLSQAKLYNCLRKVLIALGILLKDKSLLEEPEDIFFLTVEEVEGILYATSWDWNELNSLINIRKKSILKNTEATHQFPLVRENGLRTSLMRRHTKTTNADPLSDLEIIRGTGASAGIVQGLAQIVNKPEDINPGTIVITSHTDPAWVLYLPLIKGLIVEKGGILSHAAIVSREFNVPTIVGIPSVMEIIKDGQLLEINGASGEIHFL
jgi:phosphohistidine swiveling domain-containing protein